MTRRRRSWALTSVAALAAACGGGEPDPSDQAEAGVASVVARRLEIPPSEVVVRCPEEVDPDATAPFTCSVAVAGGRPVDVELHLDKDGVIELARAVVPTDAAEAYLAAELSGPAEAPVQADCGDDALLVADVGDELRCDVVRTSDGSRHTAVLTVLSLDGTVRYRVEAAGSVAGSAGSTSTTSPP